MMIRALLLSICFTLGIYVSAQNNNCNEFRYLVQIFVDTTKEEDVLYGQGLTPAGSEQELYMDIYDPQGDTLSIRALIIVVHGGAFSGGSKEDVQAFCERYAERGYVVAAIDYRNFDLDLNENTTEEEFIDWLVKASGDVKAAVRFFRESIDNGNPYGIGPDNFFVAGISYGGIIAMHAGMADPSDNVSEAYLNAVENNGGWEGNSNSIMISSHAEAVVSYSGAIIDADWINLSDPGLLAFHDDQDPVIPFSNGFIAPDGQTDLIEMQGGSSMEIRAMQAGTLFELVVNENSDQHLGYFDENFEDSNTIDASCNFYYDIICNGVLSDSFEEVEAKMVLYPNPTSDKLHLDTDRAISHVSIRNFAGQEIQEFSTNQEIDLSQLDQGLYYLLIEFENTDQTLLKKVIKN